MKIAMFAPGCSAAPPLDFPTRGEGRWTLNWAHILREEGHQVDIIHERSTDNGIEYDWYLNAPWWGEQSCYSAAVRFKKHAHLYYGTVKGDSSVFNAIETEHTGATCIKDGTCNFAFGYRDNYFDSLSTWGQNDYTYNLGCMPIPFSESMFPGQRGSGFNRNTITWMSKEIFHPNLISGDPDIPALGVEFLKALVKLRRKVDFNFVYLVNPPTQPTEEARALLSELNPMEIKLLPFTQVLQLMSSVKINLGVAGTASSTIDSIYSRAVPLNHAGSFMTHTAVKDLPESLLPAPRQTTVDDIYPVLERLWFDPVFYRFTEDCYQHEFAAHRKENALRSFYSFEETAP